MTLRYKFSQKAEADLEAILEYSSQRWGAVQTLAYIDELQDRIVWLTENPQLGRPRDELLAGLRSYPQGRHMLYYAVTDQELLILRIRHQSAEIPDEDELAP